MPLSTFNSDSPQYARALRNAIIAFLIFGVLLCTAFEFVTRTSIYKMSASLGRLKSEIEIAEKVQSTGGQPTQVLLMGNSLLMAAVDVEQLNRGLGSNELVTRLAVTQTTYLDWYYGMRRILAHGTRPDWMVLCFEPRHLVQSNVRSEIFAHYLMQLGDLFRVRESLDLHPTDTADFAVANVSDFYALRKEIRKNILTLILPDLPNLTAVITRAEHPAPTTDEISEIGKKRLREMSDLAASKGVRFALLVVPPLDVEQAEIIKSIGESIGVPVLVPITNEQLSPQDYEADEYHLNAAGRDKYMDAVLPLMQSLTTYPAASQ